MKLPRGFKASANRISVGLRHQLKLPSWAPIDLHDLAEKLGLILVPITDFSEACPKQLEHLIENDAGAFSALLLPVGNGRRIVLYNDANSPGRRNSDLAHEISHALLAHRPSVLFNGAGCRDFDPGTEAQANCLAGHILIPDEAARRIVYGDQITHAVCETYGVSRQMLEYRLNASGARKVHRRWQQKHRQ